MANDVFDTCQGADDANVTPTQFSGGSRVIQYGLVSAPPDGDPVDRLLRAGRGHRADPAGHARIDRACWSSVSSGSSCSLGYTAPPLKFVYRGLGEIAVALGFGPLMLLGAYVVQTRGALAWEPFVASIPVALLVALILYVNEIPDRRGDARAGKRTLPVRFSSRTIIARLQRRGRGGLRGLVAGVVAGLLPDPGAADAAHDPARAPGLARPRARTTTTRTASWRSWASTSSSTSRGRALLLVAYVIVDRGDGPGAGGRSVPRLMSAAPAAEPRHAALADPRGHVSPVSDE